jgi:flagellin
LVAVSVLDSSVLSGISPRAADADAIASVAREAASSRAFAATVGGISVRSDRLQVAVASRYASEAATLAAVRGNAQYAASLAQAANDALLEIDEKLAQLEELAASAQETSVTDAERIRLELEFQQLMADIDRIAATAHFDGRVVLGGDGSGGPYTLTVRVGSGTDESDEVTISISAATVEDLSSDLADDTLRTAEAAETAADNVAAAREALGVRLGEARGGIVRADIAGLAADQGSIVAENARRDLIDPETAVDFSRLVAERVADEGDLNLFKDAERQLRDLLIRLGEQTAGEEATKTAARETTSEPTTGAGESTSANADEAASSPTVQQDE